MQNKPLKIARAKQQLLYRPRRRCAFCRFYGIWKRPPSRIVVNAHPERRRPNYKTTQTLLRIMEQKGFITHESRGRVFVFRPLASRKTIDRLSVQELISRNFRGSASGLLVSLLEANPIKKNELDGLEEYIREYRKRHDLG